MRVNASGTTAAYIACMTADFTRPESIPVETPLDDFSHAHDGLLAGIRRFGELPALAEAAEQARDIAARTLHLLDSAVTTHHADEEGELFPAVLKSARPGVERDRVQALADRLVEEHREIEDLWKHLRPDVKLVAQGRHAAIPRETAALLVRAYDEHARFEEQEFLPLAREILSRDPNHMSALELSLHMRHMPLPNAYV